MSVVSWLVLSCCALACEAKERRASGSQGGATPIELVQTWSGPNNQVLSYQEVTIPGYELFWVRGLDRRGSTGFAVAVPVDEQNFLEGKIALKRLIATGVDDPLDLARLTMIFLERGGIPLIGPQAEHHKELGVEPPAVAEGVLSYWYERKARTHIELLRSELTLGDLILSTKSMMVTELDHPAPDHKPQRQKPKNHP